MQEIKQFVNEVIHIGKIIWYVLVGILILALTVFTIIIIVKCVKAIILYFRIKRIKRVKTVGLITGRYHVPWKEGWFGNYHDEEWNVEIAYLLPEEKKERYLTFDDPELYDEVKYNGLHSINLVLDVYYSDKLDEDQNPEVLKTKVVKNLW